MGSAVARRPRVPQWASPQRGLRQSRALLRRAVALLQQRGVQSYSGEEPPPKGDGSILPGDLSTPTFRIDRFRRRKFLLVQHILPPSVLAMRRRYHIDALDAAEFRRSIQRGNCDLRSVPTAQSRGLLTIVKRRQKPAARKSRQIYPFACPANLSSPAFPRDGPRAALGLGAAEARRGQIGLAQPFITHELNCSRTGSALFRRGNGGLRRSRRCPASPRKSVD
jgi:hypothetical protein